MKKKKFKILFSLRCTYETKIFAYDEESAWRIAQEKTESLTPEQLQDFYIIQTDELDVESIDEIS